MVCMDRTRLLSPRHHPRPRMDPAYILIKTCNMLSISLLPNNISYQPLSLEATLFHQSIKTILPLPESWMYVCRGMRGQLAYPRASSCNLRKAARMRSMDIMTRNSMCMGWVLKLPNEMGHCPLWTLFNFRLSYSLFNFSHACIILLVVLVCWISFGEDGGGRMTR